MCCIYAMIGCKVGIIGCTFILKCPAVYNLLYRYQVMMTSIFICFVVSFILPLPELIVEGMGARLGRDDVSAFKVRAICGEVVGFMFVENVAEVLGTFDLAMPFFVAVVTGDGSVVNAVVITECFFRGSMDGSGDVCFVFVKWRGSGINRMG